MSLRQRKNKTLIAFPPASSKPLPLVERTNKLPLEQFISYYVSPSTSESHVPDDITLDIYSAHSIPAEDFEACFRLVELTSEENYSGSSVGWSPSKKRKEMKLPDMRYLILRRSSSKTNDSTGETEGSVESSSRLKVLGFLSLMVTYEDGKEVIYCYEIHLLPAAQGQGFGKLLMGRLEDIGRRIGLEKAMLTAFKSNPRALQFYGRLGYSMDEYSPQPRILRNGTMKEPDYLILSKPLREVYPDVKQGAHTQDGDK